MESVHDAAADLEPTFACSPPPGTARVDAVLAAARGRAPDWVLARLPDGYRGVVAPLDAHAPDGLDAAWAAGLARTTAPVVALLDGRSGVDPRELERLAEPVARGSADVVVAVRRAGWDSAALWRWPLHRRLLDAATARRMDRRLAERVTRAGRPGPSDVTGRPLRLTDAVPALAGRRQLLAAVDGAGPEALLAAAAAGGWRVAQVPVRCGPGPLHR
ncbi:glycosyltransferase [Quadrisphaera oryzae]|uniref:glycosyltransferase n=1 Tax=Quadrisphaera TaxID=317661 RepID=UPI0016456926|nr:glycosyltransferase [Quadrisphaera sp. RL12-1S]MBC3764211.1 glycosyltransferase [Quadrisphaera sp. RL12-1S]